MNAKIRKVDDDIERTKAKIAELQALVPELERKKTDLENTEIVRLVRSADVAPDKLTAFVEAYKAGNTAARPAAPPASAYHARQEVSDNGEE